MLLALAAGAAGRSNCTTFELQNVAVLSLGQGNLHSYDVATAIECAAACCALKDCSAWTFTPILQDGFKKGCCFPKAAARGVLEAHIVEDQHYITGCVGQACPPPKPSPPKPVPTPHPPPPPPSPTPPLPRPYARPRLTVIRTIANVSDGGILRDPTTAVFDPISQNWHVYCTKVPAGKGVGGYPGTIWHFSLNSSNLDADGPGKGGMWKEEGQVLDASHSPAFDGSGVFTPGMVMECNSASSVSRQCKWYLFFGGVADQKSSHYESVGVAVADSPFGPFQRYAHNPVFTPTDDNTHWCTGSAARVDEIKATVIQGAKYLAVKCVCGNFTALPVFYSPVDQKSWAPPYKPSHVLGLPARTPMYPAARTCGGKGFEEPTFFVGPDRYLHFLGHDHGTCPGGGGHTYQHLLSPSGAIDEWQDAGHFAAEPGHPFEEPVPVPADGTGVFGDLNSTGVPTRWVDFVAKVGDSHISLCSVEWVWSNKTSPSYV